MSSLIDEELVGVPRSVAARVIGVSERRLTHWNVNGLVRPSASTNDLGRSIWTFVFDDLVQGRCVRELENRGAHVLNIRRMVDDVRSAEFSKPLAELSWATDAGEVFVLFPNGSWYGGRRPNQAVMSDILQLEQIRRETREALERPRESQGRSERRRGAMGSKELFEGTRVPVDTISRYLAHGFDEERILASYPSLTRADIDLVRNRMKHSA